MKTCDAIVAVPFLDGKFGMGVFREVEALAASGKPAYQLSEGEIRSLDFKDISPLSVNETRSRVKQKIQ